MLKANPVRTDDAKILDLIRIYEEVMAELHPLDKQKKQIWEDIKELMGKAEEKIVPGFGKVTFKFDKDKKVQELDFDLFKKEQPKLYKKYVKEETTKGARRLVLVGMGDE